MSIRSIVVSCVPALVVSLGWAVFPAGAQEPDPIADSSCVRCHTELEDGESGGPVQAWQGDVHLAAGLGCESCHGGDPSADLWEDPDRAMDPARGFRPAPSRLEIARFCARCHSDAEFMKRYDPQARVDQLTEYLTSVHGRANAGGDPRPATCTDCHGTHGIRPVDSPDSPVYAFNVPATCARCHSNGELMAAYELPANQHELYLGSAHAAALLGREDVAAPACNDCHGNHGATPPGVESVANVCGQCHAREANLFRASFKKELFDALEVSECVVCHDNHRIVHPEPEFFRTGSAPRASRGAITRSDPLAVDLGDLAAGESAEVEWSAVLQPLVEAGDVRFRHRVEVSARGLPPLALDATIAPGFDEPSAELSRTEDAAPLQATLTADPLSGIPVRAGDAVRFRLRIEARGAPVHGVRVEGVPGKGVHTVTGSVCMQCHAPDDECDRATGVMYEQLQAAERELRESERRLRRAELAGMDVGEVMFELNSGGTTAALDARALIHSFEPERLVARTEEAREIARVAAVAGREAMDELQFRRKGLAVSLVLVLLVLVGLSLKIREIDRSRA